MSPSPATPPRSRGRVAAGLVALAGIGASLLPGLAAPALAQATPVRTTANGVVLAPETYAFTDISGTGTRLALANIDDGAATVSLGFPLTVHTASGTAVQTGAQVQMGANGFASIKTASRTTKVSPVSGDWGLWNGGIFWSSTGEVGQRRFVAQFQDIVPRLSQGNAATYQVVIDEGSPTIHVAYADSSVDVAPAPTVGVAHTEQLETRSAAFASAAPSGTQYRIDVTPPDDSAPVVTPTVTGTAGRNGFHTTSPSVSWDVTDAQSPVLDRSGCDAGTVSSDTSATGVTFTCTAHSGGGSTTQSVTLRRDTVAPTASSSVTPATPNGKDGWYVSAPTVTVACDDATPGSGLETCAIDGTSLKAKTLGSAAGPQDVTATAADLAGHRTPTAVKALQVDLADPVITCPTPPSYVYGSTAAALSAAVTDSASGAVQPHVSVTPDTKVDAGEHTVRFTASDRAGRSTSVDCGYTVTRAAASVTAHDLTKVYGADVPATGWTGTGLVAGDDASALKVTGCTTPVTSTTGVGRYAVTCSTGANARYDVRTVDGTATVTPAPLTVVGARESRTYGEQNPELAPSYLGLAAGDAAADIDTPAVCATDADSTSHAGSYPVTCSGAADANYTVTYEDGSLLITAADLVVTAKDATKTYGEANPALGAVVKGLAAHDTEDALTGLVCTTPAVQTSGVGSYSVSCTADPNGNYDVDFVDASLTVTPASLTVTASGGTAVYGAAVPAVDASYSGFVAGDDADDLTSAAVCTTTATQGSGVGGYDTACTGAAGANYTVGYTSGLLEITPAAATVIAPDATRVYGASEPTLVPAVRGLVAGDTADVLGDITCEAVATSQSDVGERPTSCTGGQSANYTVSHERGTLQITPAPLTVTALDARRVYGAVEPELAARYTGLVAGDTAATLDAPAVCTSAADERSPVGDYAISCDGVQTGNYTVTYVQGTLEVVPAAATVTAPDATRVYGAGAPSLLPQVTGLVAGDTALAGVSCTTAAGTDSAVGDYATTCSGSTSSDYDVTYVAGTLAVTAAPLTVVAPDATREQGAADPALEPAYSGLTAGDTVADLTTQATCTTDATRDSPAGTYVVTCTGATSPNYLVTEVDGVLTITEPAAPPVLTAPTSTVVADATSPAGTTVSYSVTAAASGKAVPVTCTKAAGTTFPIGRTKVSCAADRTDAAEFTVHVRGAAEQLVILAGEVTGKGPGKSLQQQVGAAIKARPALAKIALTVFKAHLKAQSGKSITAAQAKDWTADADRIIAVIG